MDHKTLVNRFTKACYRFEAIQEDLDILLFDTDDEIKANEYEDLADQAAKIVLKLSANGNNVGMHFYNYYLCRLEYIIAYFRELLDDEETPLAEDEENAATDEPDAAEDAGGEDKQPEELDDGEVAHRYLTFLDVGGRSNKSDWSVIAVFDRMGMIDASYPPSVVVQWYGHCDIDRLACRAAPISDDDLPLPPGVEEKPANLWLGWDKLMWEERQRVKDSVALFYRLDDITAQDDESPAAPILTLADSPHTLLRHYIRFATAQSILAEERELRRLLWKAIDAIPDFRDSEEFKTIIEQYPTYKEIKQ